MAAGHLINRVTILGTGLIGGSFALALRKYATGLHISGWDRTEVISEAHSRGAVDAPFYGDLGPALQHTDLIYLALPISVTLDLLPEIARLAPAHALVTDACSTKQRIRKLPQKFSPLKPARYFWPAIRWQEENSPASRTPTPISSAIRLTL
jgi:prephenate dehydrogenase